MSVRCFNLLYLDSIAERLVIYIGIKMKLYDETALSISKKIKEGKITAMEAVEACFDKIKEREENLHCYVLLQKEEAMEQAKKVQQKISAGLLTGAFAGVPFAVKDNICVKGMETTCCSKILKGFKPTYTATAADHLIQQGAILIGKTNMDEFAMGNTTETSCYGATKNPWKEEHVPGGSSGGSCAAVAAKECFFSLGSDTGGSIRQPSSFCGVTGIKPTYGTVSRYGLVAYASSLDQIGPVGKNVSDCAAILEAIASYDKKDTTSMKRKSYSFTDSLKRDIKGLKFGIPKDYMKNGLDEEVKEAVYYAAKELEKQGAKVEEFELGFADYAVPAYYIIACAEASSNLSRFDGVKYGVRAEEYEGLHDMYKKTRSEGFGTEVKRRIMLGSFVLSSGYYDAYYLKALKTKALIKEAFDRVFAKYDIILAPAAPTTAPKLSESLKDPIKMYLGDIYTVSVNLAGLPAVCIPCGINKKGLPIGLQMIGNCFEEEKLLRAAYTYEKTREFELLK